MRREREKTARPWPPLRPPPLQGREGPSRPPPPPLTASLPPPPSTQQAKHLGLRFKERYTTRDGLHARVTGLLDTVTGGFAYAARLEKVVGPPLPPAGAPWAAKREALARPRAAVGLAYCSRRDAVLARVAAGGAADLGGEAWLSGKAVAEVDTRTQKVSVCV